jgi:hypothetical protein
VFFRRNVRVPSPFSDDPNTAIEVRASQVSENRIGGFRYPDSEFLVKFPDESLGGGFPLFDMAAW